MKKDIEQFIKECDECQRSKRTHEYRAPLSEVMEARFPFDFTSLDITGPYAETPRKNRYLLTFLDHFSRCAEAIPVHNISAELCARAYVTHVISLHGSGSWLLSDRGSNFPSSLFSEVCKILGVKQITTTAYHPQTNGALKRYHKTMHRGLSHYINAAGTSWDTLVPLYLMAYRSLPHSSTGFTPYYLLHGREMVIPTTQSLKPNVPLDEEKTDQAAKLENLKSSLRRAYKLVRENTRKSHAYNKRYYDRLAKARSFTAGDLVYVFCPAVKAGRSSKFHKAWSEPCQITAKKSDLNYEIVDHKGKKTEVHINRLKPAYNPRRWQELSASSSNKRRRRQKPRRVETEELVLRRRPLVIPNPATGDDQPTVAQPRRDSSQGLDTPADDTPVRAANNRDPDYETRDHRVPESSYKTHAMNLLLLALELDSF
jgi:transposase InsO family protein